MDHTPPLRHGLTHTDTTAAMSLPPPSHPAAPPPRHQPPRRAAATRPTLALALALAAITTTHAATDLVIAVGAHGSETYRDGFTKAAEAWSAAAQTAGARVHHIGPGTPDPDPEAQSDRARLESTLSQLATTTDDDPLWIVLIGHGTYDGRAAKFNLRGDDLSASDLAQWLEDCTRPTAIINTTAASAPFIPALSREDRIIVTATRSGSEDSFARFGGFLATSISDPAADIDQDGATSLLEAFLAASKLVAESYEQQGRLATEHSLVDDNGDRRGTPAEWFRGTRPTQPPKDASQPDGLRAHQLHLIPSEFERSLPPELRAQRDTLEAELAALRAKKSTMPEDEYFNELERIARKLAKIYTSPPTPE